MIDVLPASVESVTLTEPMLRYIDVAKMVKGLAKHEAKKDPKLDMVFYESCKSFLKLVPILWLFSKVGGIDFIWDRGENECD